MDGVSLSVQEGALFGLLGPNDSGKTTMIKMLTGQVRPTGDSATILGLDVEADPIGVRERIEVIPEQETPPVCGGCQEDTEHRREGGLVVRLHGVRR